LRVIGGAPDRSTVRGNGRFKTYRGGAEEAEKSEGEGGSDRVENPIQATDKRRSTPIKHLVFNLRSSVFIGG
jgi:hypothetical protein